MKCKIILPVFWLLLAATTVQGQTLSLEGIIDSIRLQNPVIRMYNNEIRSMDAAASGARSWMPPELGVGQFMTPYNVSLWRKDGDMKGMGSVMFSGQQMFSNRKKLDADEAYMKSMSAVEKEQLKANLNDLVGEAKLLYFDWVILQKKTTVLKQNEQLLDFMIRNAELRYKNGLEKISAYYKAKAALGNLKNMQLLYDNDIREKRIRLNTLMGRNATTVFNIDTSYELKDFSGTLFDSTLFYANRSDLKAIDRSIDLTRLKQETERQALKPQFGIRYDHMIGFGGQPMQYTLMGMVKIPLAKWSSKMNKANIESLKWKAEALQSQKAMLANEYSGMAYGMRNEMEVKHQQLDLYKSNIIPALKNNYKSMQLAYEQNTQELFMLYDAWETLNMTELAYIDILGDILKAQVSLEKILEKQ